MSVLNNSAYIALKANSEIQLQPKKKKKENYRQEKKVDTKNLAAGDTRLQ